MTWNHEELSQAIVVCFGFGVSASPIRDNSKVLEVFGRTKGQELLDQIDHLIKEANQTPVDWTNATLEEAGDLVRSSVNSRYPGLTDRALNAIAWKFTFDWR